ncbi:MAG: antibiotic biosynthesis monooxygenase [Bryobacterales bacterium]|nr:antibiotic biosynthesis monooxygenase [Bryobacterales bacterium]MBV9399530.1 antibiotic biosynthesis monooxygenase [Bryobacterales bacterium]
MQRLLLLLISAVLLCAQAPPDSTAYSVAYVDIAPASRNAAIAAIKQYRDASRKDGGFQRIEFFEQAGRPAHFCIVETWAKSKDLDSHAASANAKDFRTKLDSMRLSDYDQRPYKSLSLGAAHNDGSSRSTFVIAHVDIGGQGTNAADLLRKLAEASRKEEGNLRFDVLQHAMRANHFTVIEEWQSAKAMEAHAAAAHTKEYRNSLGPIAGSPLDERLYKAVE